MYYSPFKTIIIHFCPVHKTMLTQKCLAKMFCYRVYVKGYFFMYRPPKVRPKNLTIGGRYFYG